MTEQFLYEADVGASFEHVCSAGVPKEVARAAPLDPAARKVALDEVAKAIVYEGVAAVGEEQSHSRRATRQSWSRIG